MIYTSIVAILVCAKCIKSNVSKRQVTIASQDFFSNFFAKRYISGNINIPNTVPTILQPNGHIPNILIPIEINTLPSGG